MMKEKLQTGDILHCTGNRLLSRLIRKFTKSRFSHTAVVVECWGQTYIVDAQRNGVNARYYLEWLKEFGYDFIVSRPKQELNKEEFSIKAFSRVGFTKYDIASLLWYQPIYILTGKWKGKDRYDSAKRMYCSEFVAFTYKMPNFWKMSPQDVYKYCVNNPNEFKTEQIE